MLLINWKEQAEHDCSIMIIIIVLAIMRRAPPAKIYMKPLLRINLLK